jgi:polyhydroxybutyrate depolymerase
LRLKKGTEVTLYVIEGGGHTWPGKSSGYSPIGKVSMDIDATEFIWEFFQMHPKAYD